MPTREFCDPYVKKRLVIPRRTTHGIKFADINKEANKLLFIFPRASNQVVTDKFEWN